MHEQSSEVYQLIRWFEWFRWLIVCDWSVNLNRGRFPNRAGWSRVNRKGFDRYRYNFNVSQWNNWNFIYRFGWGLRRRANSWINNGGNRGTRNFLRYFFRTWMNYGFEWVWYWWGIKSVGGIKRCNWWRRFYRSQVVNWNRVLNRQWFRFGEFIRDRRNRGGKIFSYRFGIRTGN